MTQTRLRARRGSLAILSVSTTSRRPSYLKCRSLLRVKNLMRDCDRTIVLRDGRTLGFAEYGDPDGFPVIYSHGGMSSRIDATSAGDAAATAGFKVIAPDRAGIGLSDRHKGAMLLDWPRDVAELADTLGIGKFAVMGWSFGGAYAAASGFALPDRVTTTVLIASGIPRDWPGMTSEINRLDRIFMKLSGSVGLADEAAFVAIRIAASRTPQLFIRTTIADMSEQSRDAITRDPEEFVQSTIAGFSHPAGALDDYRIWDQPWGFDLAQISGPVQIWHGQCDELCPPEWGRRLAGAIPTAELHEVPQAGHFVARDHWKEIFDYHQPATSATSSSKPWTMPLTKTSMSALLSPSPVTPMFKLF